MVRGGVVSRLIMVITGVTIQLLGVISTLNPSTVTKSP